MWIWAAISAVVAALALIATLIWRMRDKSSPLIEYSISRSTPVRVEKEMIGAFTLKVRCKAKIAEDVTVHLVNNNTPIQLQDPNVPTGLKYEFESEENNNARIFLPNFQVGDDLSFTLVARGSYVPQVMQVVIRSPKLIRTKQINETSAPQFYRELLVPLLTGVSLALAFVASGTLFHQKDSSNPASNHELSPEAIPSVRNVPKVVLTEAASDAGIDALVTFYAQSVDPFYYTAGDIAVSRASTQSDQEKEKYKQFLTLVLNRALRMAPESKAKLLYSRAKIEAQLNQIAEAKGDINASESIDPKPIKEMVASDTKLNPLIKP
jgi:hypothetical protein